jgi:hypothetical protein
VSRLLIALALAAMVTSALGLVARADPGPWRRTTPRAVLEARGEQEFLLRVPSGRAWGIQSVAEPVEPGKTYRVGARLDVMEQAARGSFVRVAFYSRPDGRGRQGLVVDGDIVPGGDHRLSEACFVVPEWARSVKVRVLVRRFVSPLIAEQPVHASVGALQPYVGRPPPVVLREVD